MTDFSQTCHEQLTIRGTFKKNVINHTFMAAVLTVKVKTKVGPSMSSLVIKFSNVVGFVL
jgi:hypothetical protein